MITKTRTWSWLDKDNKPQRKTAKYFLYYNKGILQRVINEFGYSVERNSECFEFFSKLV